MNDIIRHSEDQPPTLAISETQVGPKKSTDSETLWNRFWNFIRTHIGLKPLHLAERVAVAKTRVVEAHADATQIDNQLKLIRAKQEYELIQSQIRVNEMKAAGELEKAQAEADAIRGKIRSKRRQERIEKAAEQAMAKRAQSPDEAMDEILKLIHKIEAAGGEVNFVIPDSIPPHDAPPSDDQPDPPKG